MSTTPHITEIIQTIAKGHTEQALILLKKMSDELDIPVLLVEHATLSSQFYIAQHNYRTGTVADSDHTLIINTINKRMLQLLVDFQNGNLPQIFNNSVLDKGRIVHNIPGEMVPQKPVICCVRIAKNEDLLFDEDLSQDEVSPSEALAISREMTVTITDPFGDVFDIARIPPGSTGIQRINYDEFTEWNFRVTPLKNGKHKLWMIASTVVDGIPKEKRFFKNIEITATASETSQPWQATDVVIDTAYTPDDTVRRKRGFWSWLSSASAAMLAFGGVVAVAALGGLAYLLLNSSYATPILQVDPKLGIETVTIGGKPMSDWIANEDSTEITLPKLGTNQSYLVVVRGRNGVCTKTFTLEKKQPVVQMDCEIRPDSVQPILLFSLPVTISQIELNGALVSNWQFTPEDSSKVLLPPVVKNQSYQIKVTVPNGHCNKEVLITDKAFHVSMPCVISPPPTVEAETYTARLKVPRRLLGSTRPNTLRVQVESFRSVGNPSEEGEFVIFRIRELEAGNYAFKLLGLESTAMCGNINHRIERDVTLEFDCEERQRYVVYLMATRMSFPSGDFKNLRIRLDNQLLETTALEHVEGALFIINVAEGSHIFELINVNSAVVCSPITASIRSGRRLTFQCSYVNPDPH